MLDASEQEAQQGTVLTGQNKALSLFQFIKELNKLKQKTIVNIRDYPWYFTLSNLPNDTENISVYYRDRVEDEEDDTSDILLSVHKPEFEACPVPDKLFIDWLCSGWEDYRLSATALEFKVLDEDEEYKELFTDQKDRVLAYEKWLSERTDWSNRQRIIEQTRILFTDLYRLYHELKRESETKEIIVANGILCDAQDPTLRHPVLTHRVKLDYDADTNTVFIKDVDVPTELYSIAFQTMQDVNLTEISQVNAELHENDYHPLDRNDMPDFLKVLVHQLSSSSIFAANKIPANWASNNRLLLYLEPCYIVRNRLDGTLKAIEQIIENVQDTDYVPAPIEDIVNGGIVDVPEDAGEEPLEEQLAAVGGESVDILLSKEANKEQLEIARRIEHYNAVLVQGPPGTGKTHTIANLMGHFLAQGKSILVTSHTPKALSVLKEKVAPGLQNLCVSLLEDSNIDMERSIDGITDYMSKTTSHELKREMDSLAERRRKIVDSLADTRRKLFSIINRECNNIVYNGEGISPSKAAEFVMKHEIDLAYIPGEVRSDTPLPLTFAQLSDLYRSNESISAQDETELTSELPNPAELLSVADFEQTLTALHTAQAQLTALSEKNHWEISNRTNDCQIDFHGDFGDFTISYPTKESVQDLRDCVDSFGTIEKWMKCAAVDGKNGGAFRQRWVLLIEQIEKTCNYAESTLTEQFGRDIVFSDSVNVAEFKPSLEGLKETFHSKGKIGKFTLLFHKDYDVALKSVTIDGNQLQSEQDCDVALHNIELTTMRKQCAAYWDELLSGYDIPTFYELDKKDPEGIANKLIPHIKQYLDWYATDYKPLQDKLSAIGIPAESIFFSNALDSDLIATEKILCAVEDTIPQLCEACAKILEIKYCTFTLAQSKSVVYSEKRVNSKICSDIAQAIAAENVKSYSEAIAALGQMYTKYELQRKRNEMLKVLEPIAPQWADAIRNRDGIHGGFTVPHTIEDAWKWKQLSCIIAEITAKPFHDLQADSVRLSKEYRKITAVYAEKCGWYHLLRRTETDITMRHDLQGWRLTIKKIGKGTGKKAPALKAEARKLMTRCQVAVPCWIMPISRALDSLNPKENRFDVVIIDEASQSDISSLAILYMGKKLIIVGDDKQVSPMAVGVETEQINNLQQIYLSNGIPNAHLYDAKTSIYDIAATTFQPLMLREHFRCVPEIIGFSNMLSYNYKIKPLRDASNSVLLPAVVNYRVANGVRSSKINRNEAKAIVALMKACMEQPEYNGKTFGVISLLGNEQVKVIQQLIEQEIEPREIEQRSILCGNSANFQGDERDVIFLSVVDSADGSGPIRMQGYGADDSVRKRYNVASSRARDQLWIVDSLDSANDLKPGDIRKTLIDYSINPHAVDIQHDKIAQNAESPFELAVTTSLSDLGYHLVQQWQVGAYRLDIVAVNGKKTVAIECDGERWHSGEAKIREDMERQAILERLGWRFIRIRGSEYFRNPEAAIQRVVHELTEYGIEPEDANPESVSESRNTELLFRVKNRAAMILKSSPNDVRKPDMETIAAALDSKCL